MKEINNKLEIEYIKNKYKLLYQIFLRLPWITAILIIIFTFSGYMIFLFWWQWDYPYFVFIIAIFILLYYQWWLIRSLEYILFVFMSAFNLNKSEKRNNYKILFDKNYIPTKEEQVEKDKIKNDISAQNIVHRFIIPTYKESYEILDTTMCALKDAIYNHKQFAITIAWEERDEDNFKKIAKKLMLKYKDDFGYINFSIHPKNIPWEFPWKWWNITFAAKNEYKLILEKFGVNWDEVLVTTLDADTNIHKDYANVLTLKYLSEDNRVNKSYQPMILFFNNFWEAPFFSKIVSLLNSFWILFNSTKTLWMRNFSTHSQPLEALIKVNFWSTQTIVEDWHQYRRSFFWLNWDYSCVPIYTTVYQDSNLSKNLFSTAKSQYNQIRRWAHWAEDVPYLFCQYLENKDKILFWRFFYEFARLFEWTVMWATLHFILMLWLTFSIIKDVQLSSFISLWSAISIFINISILVLILSVSLQIYFCPWWKLKWFKNKFKYWFWFLFPYLIIVWPTLFIFTWLPAIHTQIALILWKPFKNFNVTEKVRK